MPATNRGLASVRECVDGKDNENGPHRRFFLLLRVSQRQWEKRVNVTRVDILSPGTLRASDLTTSNGGKGEGRWGALSFLS